MDCNCNLNYNVRVKFSNASSPFFVSKLRWNKLFIYLLVSFCSRRNREGGGGEGREGRGRGSVKIFECATGWKFVTNFIALKMPSSNTMAINFIRTEIQ